MNKKIVLFLFAGILFNVNYAQKKTIQENLFFGMGKIELTNEHKDILNNAIAKLNKYSDYSCSINGYSCNIGSISMNKVISNLRALNVYNYMVDHGIPKNQVSYHGFGSSNPKYTNNTAKGRSMNRRVEVKAKLDDFSRNETNLHTTNTTQTVTKKELLDKLISKKLEEHKTTTSSSIVKNEINAAKTSIDKISSSSNGNSNNATSKQSEITSKTEMNKFKTLEFGPEFNTGKLPVMDNKEIKVSNNIVVNLDQNTFVTSSKEPIDFDFKDYTTNYDIVKKGLTTNSKGHPLMLLGAFSVSSSQAYEDLTLNSKNPMKIFIPSEYDPEIKLYNNSNNWTLDTINVLGYDTERNGYFVKISYMNSIFGLLKPVSDSAKNVLVKIVGIDPTKVKPYIIQNNGMISSGTFVKGKLFSFPLSDVKSSFKLRAAYTDYSSKNPTYYFLNENVKNISTINTKEKIINSKKMIRICIPSKIQFQNTKMDRSSMDNIK